MKKTIFLLFTALLVSCNAYELDESHSESIQEGVKLYAQKHPDEGVQLRGVSLKDKQWNPGETICIKFLNGTAAQQNKVKDFSKEWLDYANLVFEFVEPAENADVKIAFDWQGDQVTWSMIGADARKIPQSVPSLNFGKLSSISAFAKRDILMQFGHVLGLVNEHQGVNNPTQLDADIVYAYYLEEGWSVKEINDFFFTPYTGEATNYTAFDSKSIMVWPIDEIFTTNGTGQSRNSQLSETDKAFVAQLYPAPAGDKVTRLGVSMEQSFTVDLQEVLNTNGYVEIDFGDRDTYAGPGNSIPRHMYPAGEYTIGIEADRISLQFLDARGLVMSDGHYLKSVKLNGSTEYEYIHFFQTDLESIACDPENPPLLLQTEFNWSFFATKIASLPENLFYNCTEATVFYACFNGCYNLTGIPEKLFYNCTEAIDFSACFQFCGISHIPEKLFHNSPKAADFSSCFCGNKITSIPAGLFKNCSNVTSFLNCFRNTDITGIPVELFENCTEAIDFGACFEECDKLTSIPEKLFDNNLKVEYFKQTFAGCSGLIGNAPALWERTNVSGYGCFYKATLLTNYLEIPGDWRYDW
ncbi:MAG: hypothetical protein LBV72_15540 [Tannerella sp.]|jgi:hypothetical protein|nr:hypothetical protein [Tannerella sp.]